MIVEKQDWDDLANYRESLEHDGVKGMEWGKHKFGKFQYHARYAAGISPPNKKKRFRDRQADAAKKRAAEKAAKEKAKAEKKEAATKAKAEKEAARKEKERQDILKSPTKLYKHRDEFTYDEIKKAMDKFKWEKELAGYSKDDLKRGADFIQTLTDYGNRAVNLYNVAARVVNSVAGDGKTNAIPFIGGIHEEKNKRKDTKKD